MMLLQQTLVLLFCIAMQRILTANIHIYCVSVPECKCKPILITRYTVDCSGLNLISVPMFSANVLAINLSHNNITVLPSNRFPRNVMHVDLSYNQIHRIENGSLQKLEQLQSLNLDTNKLEFNNKTYYPGIFNGLSKLKFLNLKNNTRSRSIDKPFYPRDFKYLTSLETLLIDGIDAEFGNQFSQLKNLTILDISGLTGNCSIPFLTPYHLRNLPYLVEMDVSWCKILRIENGTFRNFKNLQSLDISFNKDLTFRVLANVTFDLQYTDIRILKANKIHYTFGIGTELFKEDIRYLKNTTLKEVYLDSNRLEMVEFGVIPLVPDSLVYLSAADNKFTLGMYVLEINHMAGLKACNLSFQHSTHNVINWDSNNKNPQTCDREKRYPCGEELYQIPVEEQQRLQRSGDNKLHKIMNSNKSDSHVVFKLPKNCEKLHYRQNNLQYIIPGLEFSNNSVRYVDFSRNILYRWEGPLINVGAVKYIDLSHNYCSYVSKVFFSRMENLETLLINNNILGFSLTSDVEGDIFGHLHNLKYLDISNNYIQLLSSKIFVGLKKLEFLNISNNNLRHWQFNIEHMTNLRYIDFSNNQLSDIVGNVRDALDSLPGNSKPTLELDGNNFLCSCDTLEFMNWILKTKVIFKKFNKYACKYSNETVMKFQHLNESVLLLELECSSKIGLIAGLLAAILLSVMVVVGGIIYRFRWKLRYLYYMTKNKYLGYSNLNNSNYVSHFDYDAFVSYADEDRRFITKDMIENLEQNGGCRLCIHHRDFIPGLDIAANITSAIHKSNKTVVILSPSFLKSHWCMFEFNMARMESIYSRDGRDVLFLIFYDTIQVRDLPLMMLEVIDSQSYIEYPNDPQGNIVFWEKIQEAISIRQT